MFVSSFSLEVFWSVLLEKLFTSRNAMLINALFLTLIVTTVLLLLLVHHKSDFIPGVSP